MFEVEREVYWDFKSNSSEGQKVFESQKLEFPKVLSVTITLINYYYDNINYDMRTNVRV